MSIRERARHGFLGRGKAIIPLEDTRVLEYPHLTEWYATVRLELVMHAACRTLGRKTDDRWGCFEWGAGGMTHLHLLESTYKAVTRGPRGPPVSRVPHFCCCLLL